MCRKKPVAIEAEHFTEENRNRAFNFITCNHYANWDADGRPTIRIETPEGMMTASLGDWIIKGVKGEFYPCKPDIFEATYEHLRNDQGGIMDPKYAVTFGKLCWQPHPDEPVYRCAKELGHAGEHEYSDGAVTKTWPQKES